jgi:uncharacterized phage protein (TIGR02218 family)
MKASTGNFSTVIAGPEFFMFDIITITLVDATVIRLSNSDIAAVRVLDNAGGGSTLHTFTGSGDLVNGVAWKRTGTKVAVGTNVDKMTITFFPVASQLLQGLLWPQAVARGMLDGAKVVVERCALADWADALDTPEHDTATDVGAVILFSGRVSEADPSRNQIDVVVSSDMELLNVQMPRNVYQPGCMHMLFDSGCTLVKGAFTVGGIVTAGSTTRQVAASALTQADGYFDLGTVEFTSGALNGVKRTVKSWLVGTHLFQFSLPLPVAPANGDTFNAYPGCDKTKATCDSKFTNLVHFRGFSFIPSPETAH